jgi:triosephosphate isomerase
MALKKFVAGNWKMHGLSADLDEVREIASQSRSFPGVDVALCVPAILIHRAADAVPGFRIGAQDVHYEEKGAHTVSISAQMLLDAGASLTIVGHSERREAHRESDQEVRSKAEAALACGLDVILCVGETRELREQGRAVDTVIAQVEASLPTDLDEAHELLIAYEPIWAIGTGKVPTLPEIAEIHGSIRRRVAERYGEAGERMRILYGGSVKASNAAEIFSVENVDGALVGGASLSAPEFIPIVAAAAAASPVEGARAIA